MTELNSLHLRLPGDCAEVLNWGDLCHALSTLGSLESLVLELVEWTH